MIKRLFNSLMRGGALLLGALILTGCVPENLLLRYQPKSSDTVRIGAVLPLSGTHKDYGTRLLEGIRYAVDERNASRGHLGRHIDLLVVDSTSTPAGARRAVESVAASGAVAIVSAGTSLELNPAIQRAEQFRLPLVMAKVIGNDDVLQPSRFAYRIDFTPKQETEFIAAYLLYYRQVPRLGVVSSSTPDSRRLARDMAQSFKDIGGGVVRSVDLDAPQKRPLQELISYGPKAVFIALDKASAARVLKELRKIGFGGIICGGSGWDNEAFFQALTGFAEFGDCFYVNSYSAENHSDEYRVFRKNFRKNRFHLPGDGEVQGYEALNFLLIGLGNNADNIIKFKRNWMSIQNVVGVAGIYNMKSSGLVDRTGYINSLGAAKWNHQQIIGRLVRPIAYANLQLYREIDLQLEPEEEKPKKTESLWK